MSKIDELLARKPFEQDSGLFMEAMKESIHFHYENCGMYRKFCDKRGFRPEGRFGIEDIPFFPVSLFKTLRLVSVPEDEIVKDVSSSSTSSGIPSRIYLDSVTSKRQVRALNSIMSSFIGGERKDFVVFDSPDTIKSLQGHLSSRATAIRGMLPFSRSMLFILDENLELDMGALRKAAENTGKGVCFLGFTFLIYRTMERHKNSPEVRDLLSRMECTHVLHIGGWKKLRELNVDKAAFNRELAAFLNTRENKVIDIYGMTEQLGTIYPDCEFRYKHVPAYSDIIIRDMETLQPVEDGKEGFIQLLSPLPRSYPGISIISDDIGVIVTDRCRCGRKGKAFLFRSRAENAELKGCGDTLASQGD